MTSGVNLLAKLTSAAPPPFAVLYRPETTGAGVLDILIGTVGTVDSLADLTSEPPTIAGARHERLALVPYRQLTERGFAAPDDETPLTVLTVTEQETVSITDLLWSVPDVPIRLANGHFDRSDDEYADLARRIIVDEIGSGEGANFVLRRSFVGDISDYSPATALAFFRRLLQQETGAYWTFVVHTGMRTLVGASPERHVSLAESIVVMNPISGTYRYPASGPTLSGLLDFLADPKEVDELYMVVDEELKMMSRICASDVWARGPYLKEMASLAHTEYLLEGRTNAEPTVILRETMFAPTVMGSPLESAARVIAKYEPEGRGFYAGVLALIGRDAAGDAVLDSSILIRTADIDHMGRLRIGVGATLVRHSDPAAEAAETRAKAAGLVAALQRDGPARFDTHPGVRAALARRNATIAEFWLTSGNNRANAVALAGARVLIVDAEDTFTSMIAYQLRSLGLVIDVVRFDEESAVDGYDLVIMGPGPGDPREREDQKIGALRAMIQTLLRNRQPFLAVCLSHQVLALELGLPLTRRAVPNQGVQREIDFFGERAVVGFYNTFAARCGEDVVRLPDVGEVLVSADLDTGEVHGLRGPRFASVQFHAESLLTQYGVRLLAELISELIDADKLSTTAS
jgi:phenazine biosynthesis protein phzE